MTESMFEILGASCWCEHTEEDHDGGEGKCKKCSCVKFVLHPDYELEEDG